MPSNSQLIVTAAAERRASGEDGGVGQLVRAFDALDEGGTYLIGYEITIEPDWPAVLVVRGREVGVRAFIGIRTRDTPEGAWVSEAIDPDVRVGNPPVHVVETPAVVDPETGEETTPAVLRLDPMGALWETLLGVAPQLTGR